jgi:hypothetical protein
MAGGTDGNIISYDASGDPVAIATGNDGQVLTSAGAGAPPAFEDVSGGDLSFGGDTFGANKVIGANDAYSLSFETSGNTALTISANGEITKPLQPAFLVFGANMTNISADITTITLDSETYDQNSDFNTGTYTFTAPVTGRYLLTLTVCLGTMADSGNYLYTSIVTSNRYYHLLMKPSIQDEAQSNFNWNITTVADMDASDTAYTHMAKEGGTDTIDIIGSQTYFSGCLLA